MTWTQRVLRSGSSSPRDIQYDFLWLTSLGLLLIATGIGLRDPWPADEPRFALVARDMVMTGDWLLPRVGGDIYADKPPLFFWLLALGLQMTHSLRVSFLLPSLFSGLGCVVLVYDLARRLWSRETGLIAGTLLLLTVQFVWQARQAQIDATLCFWTTLSLYGLLRHLLLGPQWRWYTVGWAAAGLGVITKGVGFLPLLLLIPFALLRSPHWSPRIAGGTPTRWLIGPLAFLIAVSVWLLPVLLAARTDPVLAAYRDELLFRQTIDRYAHAWHHGKPFWYFFINVIPAMWLPLTALLPWLVPKWRQALRSRDLRIALLLTWVAIVVLFFSFSSGKRGIYVLPAVPAFVLASAPYAADLLRNTFVQRVLYSLATIISGLCAGAVAYLAVRNDKRTEIISDYDLDPLGPMLLIAAATLLLCVTAGPRRGLTAFGGVLVSVLLVVSFWVNPAMNAAHSGMDFVHRIERVSDPTRELGLVAFKEQYLLNARRPIVHFGHARWREREQEAFDAALWLSRDQRRQLVVTNFARNLCFSQAQVTSLGDANRTDWFLVEGSPERSCIERGHAGLARTYVAPGSPSCIGCSEPRAAVNPGR
jgi:4-amino-4-deoxy-L-arabinose transferase-like glycosyltransferase